MLTVTGLGADALPYCMVLVGVFVMVIMPIVAKLVSLSSSRAVLSGTTYVMIGVLALFVFAFNVPPPRTSNTRHVLRATAAAAVRTLIARALTL